MQRAPDALRQRMVLVSLLAIALVVAAWAYQETFLSILEKWRGDAAYTHGFLIVPISAWLVWGKRHEMLRTVFRPSVLGVLVAMGCTLIWVVARGSGVLVVEQLAAVGLIPALVLAALGYRATRVLVVPLAFLFLMVPFGRGLVPVLMHATADFATLLLTWTGVPVLRSHMYITIPGGSFEVARACSGLNYFVTSLVLGSLYAYLSYRSIAKRLICIGTFILIPVLLNGLRVYFTILVSHLTDMRFGPGTEHITFGKIFFVLMMLLLFWIGRRWHDDMPVARSVVAGERGSASSWPTWWPLPVACLVAMSGPPFLASSIAEASADLAARDRLMALPVAAVGWQRTDDASGRWRPLYQGGLVEGQAAYLDASGAPVDVFVAVYGLGGTMGAEMISYGNLVAQEERGSLARDVRRDVILPGGGKLVVRELVVRDATAERLVWHWYLVGGRPVVGQFATKTLEAIAFVTRGVSSERIVTLSTPYDDGAARLLQEFVTAHGACVETGFAAEACGG